MEIEVINQGEWLSGMGTLLADGSRSAMLLLLLDGRAYTATELARAAGIAAPTASHHLERLQKAGMLSSVRQGRNRYFRIANEDVAGLLEQTLAMHVTINVRAIESSCPKSLRSARRCYDHLAGALGVRMLRAGLDAGLFETKDEQVIAGSTAHALLKTLGMNAGAVQGRFCLDWSERRFHLAGPLAAGLLEGMLGQRWLLRGKQRALSLTEKGHREFRRWFGVGA